MAAKTTQMDARTIPDHATNVFFVEAEITHGLDPLNLPGFSGD